MDFRQLRHFLVLASTVHRRLHLNSVAAGVSISGLAAQSRFPAGPQICVQLLLECSGLLRFPAANQPKTSWNPAEYRTSRQCLPR